MDCFNQSLIYALVLKFLSNQDLAILYTNIRSYQTIIDSSIVYHFHH